MLQSLFVKVSSDLSYAATYYPNRSVRLYLNKLTQRVFDSIEKDRKGSFNVLNKMINFFRYVLPYELYQSKKELLLSLFIFVVAVVIGVVSSANSENFANLILGDAYIQMTEENINKGDPMAVYKSKDKVGMFLELTRHNIIVSFNAFVTGFFAGIGTLYLLLSNGIMVGAFQYFFYQKGLLATSFFTIWIHGTIEISAIIIAGGAGFVLGRGLLFPGTLSRGTSLLMASKRAVRIIIGCLPLFIMAGILESFVTRLTDLPLFIKAMIIILSAVLIIGLYVIYPWWVHKHHGDKINYEVTPPNSSVELDTSVQKLNSGEMLGHAMAVYRSTLAQYMSILFVWVLPILVISIVLWMRWYESTLIEINSISPFIFGNEVLGSYVFFMFWLMLAFLVGVCIWLFKRIENEELKLITVLRKSLFRLLFFTGIPLAIAYFLEPRYALLSMLIFTPQLGIISLIDPSQNDKFQKSLSIWLTCLFFVAIISIVFQITLGAVDKGFSTWIVNFLSWHDIFLVEGGSYIFVRSIFIYILFAIFLPVYVYCLIYIYQSYKAKQEAVDLIERFQYFGKESKIFEAR